MEACRQSNHEIDDHFSHAVKMVDIGSNAKREIEGIHLSHYACYLIIQNGDAQKQLAKVLEYSEYRHFQPVIERAKDACRNSGHPVDDHFEDILDMVEIGSGAKRQIADIRLSRYACYLIVQNGDPSKPVIANGQTYFAMQTRRQELRDNEAFARLSEDEKRVAIRNELSEHNKHLAAAAKDIRRDYALSAIAICRGRYLVRITPQTR